MKINNVTASSKVIAEIEKMVKNDSIGYIDAIVEYCNRNGLEVETLTGIIKNNTLLKSKIAEEAENLNLLEKTSKLPI